MFEHTAGPVISHRLQALAGEGSCRYRAGPLTVDRRLLTTAPKAPDMCAPRPRTVGTQSSSSRRLRSSYPRTPEKRRLGLLPFGPDPVHGTLAVWDPAFNTAFPLLSEQRTPSGGGSAPREEGFGYRAPLAPRSAHGEIVASTPVGERGKAITMSEHSEGSHSPA